MVSGFRSFTRAAIARALAGGGSEAEAFALRRWGAGSGALVLLKSGVGAITSASAMSANGSADDEFFAAVVEGAIVGRLKPRAVPFDVRILRMSTSSRGYWVGQSKAIPVSKQTLLGSSLPRRKIGAIVLATRESLDAANPLAEARVEEDLRNAVIAVLDESFVDVANAGVADESPASVTYGATSFSSSGDPAGDIADLIANFSGDLAAAVFTTDPHTAAQIALARDAGGSFAFPDCGPRGGSILGIPLLVSRSSPRPTSGGQLALIDPTGIAVALEGIELTLATATMLEADDSPTGATDTPVAQSATPVSLFQTDTVAWRVIVYANWEVQRASAVSVCTDCEYSQLTGS